MSEYEEDQFEREDEKVNEKRHKMKISVDFLTIKDLKLSANVVLSYQLRLIQQTHSFKSGKATAVQQGQEVKLTHVFAAYEFQASKSELFNMLNEA